MRPLYEIADELERVLADPECMDPETGELSEVGEQQLDQLGMELDTKALAIARYIRGERAEGAMVKAEAERLAKRARGHENRADRLKMYLERCLPVGTKLRDEISRIWWGSSQAVEITQPDRFSRVGAPHTRVSVEPDRKSIKEQIDSGVPVEGARIVKRPYVVIG